MRRRPRRETFKVASARVVETDFQVHRAFHHVTAFAATLSPRGFEAVASDPGVLAVQLDHRGEQQLNEVVPSVRASQVHEQFGFTGKGIVVAVLDSGVNKNHPDLAGAVVA